MKLENKELCKKCGGFCCKKSGCDYSPKDFDDLSTAAILKILESGNISIVSALHVENLKNNQIVISPFLYLRARNKNREIVDLYSMKTTCSMLTDTGCKYSIDDRPSGGVNLIPDEKKCYHMEDPIQLMKEWERYQKPLQKVVKRLTGKTAEEKLKEDIENTLYDFFNGNIEGVSKLELMDIKEGISLISRAYPYMLERVLAKSKIKTIR